MRSMISFTAYLSAAKWQESKGGKREKRETGLAFFC